jgi:hypothetical protein
LERTAIAAALLALLVPGSRAQDAARARHPRSARDTHPQADESARRFAPASGDDPIALVSTTVSGTVRFADGSAVSGASVHAGVRSSTASTGGSVSGQVHRTA